MSQRRFLSVLLLLGGILLFRATSGPAVEMHPFPIDWNKVPESTLDLSSFLDKPAGKDGFIRVQGEHLVKPDGKRFRVWGLNVCGPDCFPPKEDAAAIADDMARWGFNIVRFHHMDSTWGAIFDPRRDDTSALDPERMDRLDYFINELKKRGIYSNINLNVSRQYRKGDGVRDFELLGYAKGATYFNPRIIELQKQFARQMMTHFNPYTKSEYRNEPCVAVVEFVNENSLVEAWVNYRLAAAQDKKGDPTWGPLPVSYCQELTGMFNRWLGENYSPEEIAKIRETAGRREGEFIPRMIKVNFPTAAPERLHAEAKFIMGLEAKFFDEMKALLRDELGVKSLIVGSADHNDGTTGYPHIHSLARLDFIDGHGYWEHPRFDPFWIKNTPMVNDPFDSTVVQFARTPVAGRPYTISETNHPFPAEYSCEGFPILTAYSLFQDWDGIYWFDYGQPRLNARNKQRLNIFSYGNDPMKMSQLMACGLMFYRQDLKPAEKTIVRGYSLGDVIETLRLPQSERPFFAPGFGRSTPLMHATRLTFDGSSTAFPEQTSGPVVRSDTGQIAWYNEGDKKNIVTVESPNAQALIGFVKAKGKAVENLAAEVDNDFCAILVTTLDGKPIAEASELLLSATARVANNGLEWNADHQTLASWGTYPPAIEAVTGAVILKGIKGAKAVEAQPLTAEGRPLGAAIAAVQNGDQWRLPVGQPATVWYRVSVTR